MSEKNSMKNQEEIPAYDFEVFGLIKEAYHRSDGVKWIFVTAIFAYIVIALIVNLIFSVILPSDDVSIEEAKSILAMPVMVPIMLGIVMLAIKHVRSQELILASIFDYFVIVWSLVFASVAMYVLIIIGFLLLILPGIYLSVAYRFTLPLIADKQLGIWEAMERSRRTVSKRWFKFLGLDIVIYAMVLLSLLSFGIGLIWTIPIAFITNALLYHHLFDEETEELKN
jgi:uncharacterized membrane protein